MANCSKILLHGINYMTSNMQLQSIGNKHIQHLSPSPTPWSGGPLGRHRWPDNQLPPFLSSLRFPHGGAQCQAIPGCCLPISFSVCLVFSLFGLCFCMIVLASPGDLVMCPYHLSLRCSWGPMPCRVLFRTSSLEMWSLYVYPVI